MDRAEGRRGRRHRMYFSTRRGGRGRALVDGEIRAKQKGIQRSLQRDNAICSGRIQPPSITDALVPAVTPAAGERESQLALLHFTESLPQEHSVIL